MNVLRMSFLLALIAMFFVACNNEAKVEQEVVAETETVVEEVEEPVVEEVVEVEQTLAEFISGKWQQIGKDCDAEGNCKEMTKESFWNFGETEVVWSSFTNPVSYSETQILIGDGEPSPYEVASEWGDTIILHAVKTDRYMKLVKVVE